MISLVVIIWSISTSDKDANLKSFFCGLFLLLLFLGAWLFRILRLYSFNYFCLADEPSLRPLLDWSWWLLSSCSLASWNLKCPSLFLRFLMSPLGWRDNYFLNLESSFYFTWFCSPAFLLLSMKFMRSTSFIVLPLPFLGSVSTSPRA